MYDTAEAETYDQSQLDITVFRNWLLNKAQLSSYAHCLVTLGAISPLRAEGILSTSEGCHDGCRVNPKIPKAGLRGSEKKGNKLCQTPGVAQETPGRGKNAPRGRPEPPTSAAPRVHQPCGPGARAEPRAARPGWVPRWGRAVRPPGPEEALPSTLAGGRAPPPPARLPRARPERRHDGAHGRERPRPAGRGVEHGPERARSPPPAPAVSPGVPASLPRGEVWPAPPVRPGAARAGTKGTH